MNWNKIKEEAILLAIKQTKEKIEGLKKEVAALNAASEADTKSSMGDKYETGREMIQQERAKIALQLADFEKQLRLLNTVNDLGTASIETVQAGSLVVTNKANYLLSTAIGLITSNPPIFFLSPLTPIAQQMLGLKKDAQFEFNRQKFEIKEII